jgi:hypothetical protein
MCSALLLRCLPLQSYVRLSPRADLLLAFFSESEFVLTTNCFWAALSILSSSQKDPNDVRKGDRRDLQTLGSNIRRCLDLVTDAVKNVSNMRICELNECPVSGLDRAGNGSRRFS